MLIVVVAINHIVMDLSAFLSNPTEETFENVWGPYYENHYDQIPALHCAISHHSIKAARFLLNKGMNVNIKDTNRNTPLHIAVLDKNKDMIKLLVDNGADIHAVNVHKRTPYLIATQHNNKDILAILSK